MAWGADNDLPAETAIAGVNKDLARAGNRYCAAPAEKALVGTGTPLNLVIRSWVGDTAIVPLPLNV